MRAAVITSSSTYEPRASMIADCFIKQGLETYVITSDFDHRRKRKGREKKEGYIYIETVPYYRNISIQRLYSHINFSQKVYQVLQEKKFDILYVLIPANSLARISTRYSKETGARLIFDIIDLWPESLPLKQIKSVWPINLWGNLRDNNLKNAELVVTECNLYAKILRLSERGIRSNTVYWPKSGKVYAFQYERDVNSLHVVYLGSINNIIDIKMIVDILAEVQKKRVVCLHIIGDGESRDILIKEAEQKGIFVIYHGSVYDDSMKRMILRQCTYGLNIMKTSVCVGLTMKAVDYMYMGIPLINNIKGDTWELIEEYGIGINCSADKILEAAKYIIEQEEAMQEKRSMIQKIFLDNFSEEAFWKHIQAQLNPLIEKALEGSERK